MKLNSKLAHWHKTLNTNLVLPEKSLRRNAQSYELICYVNNTIALTLSKHFDPIGVFIERAEVFMSEKPDVCPDYANLVKEYFKDLKSYLVQEFNEQ